MTWAQRFAKFYSSYAETILSRINVDNVIVQPATQTELKNFPVQSHSYNNILIFHILSQKIMYLQILSY